LSGAIFSNIHKNVPFDNILTSFVRSSKILTGKSLSNRTVGCIEHNNKSTPRQFVITTMHPRDLLDNYFAVRNTLLFVKALRKYSRIVFLCIFENIQSHSRRKFRENCV